MSNKLPGMPGPSQQAIEMRQTLDSFLKAAHTALEPLIEMLPPKSKLQFKRVVQGDQITLTIQPGDNQK